MSLLARSLKLLKLNGVIRQSVKGLSARCTTSAAHDPNRLLHPSSHTRFIRDEYPWAYHERLHIINPIVINPIVFPNGLLWVPPDDDVDSEAPPVSNERKIDAPAHPEHVEKRAERLIVIRRNKMKRHKLRKLRKRMKFEWAKLRQRRELKKEKEFQAKLIAQCKEAEAFNAESYVQERLSKFRESQAILAQVNVPFNKF